MTAHTPGPWRFKEWGALIVGGGEGSSEVLICSVAINTRRGEGRHNAALIVAAPALAKASREVAEAIAPFDRATAPALAAALDRLWGILHEIEGDA